MDIEDDLKDPRYFPSPREQTILTNSIESYFTSSERSDERSLVVDNCLQELREISDHWNQRTIRQWFSNNRKIWLHPNDLQVQFNSQSAANTGVPMSCIPLKKRVPRPPSADPFQPSFLNSTNQPQTTAAPDFLNIFKSIQPGIEEQRHLEEVLTERLIKSSNNEWMHHIYPIVSFGITATDTIPGTYENRIDRGPSSKIENRYSHVESSLLVKHSPCVVDYQEGDRFFKLENESQLLNFRFPVSSICHENHSNSFFIATGTFVHQIGTNITLSVDTPPMLKSALLTWRKTLVLGNRQFLYFWPLSSVSPSAGQNYSFTAKIPFPHQITSIAGVGNCLAVASNNHSVINIINENGNLVSPMLGHAAGITAMAPLSDHLFVSGSADLTAKVWDIREPAMSIQLQLQRHLAPIKSIYAVPTSSPTYIVTGGEDHVVRLWDLRGSKVVCSCHVGTGCPSSVDYDPSTSTLKVITMEKIGTTANGYTMHKNDLLESHIGESSPHLCLSFCLNE